MAKSSVLPTPRIAHIIGGPSTLSMLKVSGAIGAARGSGCAAGRGGLRAALVRLAYSAARPRRNKPDQQHGHGKNAGGGLVREKRNLDGQHDEEGDEHHRPFPRRQAQFSVRAARAEIGGDGPDDAHGVKIRQPAHVLDSDAPGSPGSTVATIKPRLGTPNWLSF